MNASLLLLPFFSSVSSPHTNIIIMLHVSFFLPPMYPTQAVQERVVRVHTKIRSYPSKNKKIGKLQIMAQGAAQGQDIFAY